MPFKSEKQRRWMHANNPKMAKIPGVNPIVLKSLKEYKYFV